MTDLDDLTGRLQRLDTQPSATTDETVRRDLLRARGAARRRAARRVTAGIGVAAVTAVGVTLVVSGNPGTTSDRPPAVAQPSRTPDATDTPGGAVQLVSYTGAQQPGFVVTKVPQGFVLEGATAFNLNVARAGDTSGLDVFEDKLVVMLESSSVTTPPEGRPVKVGALDGWLRNTEGGTWVLTYDDGANRVVVQAWKSLGLTEEQVIEFAEGVTVTAEAQPGVG
jgi:hypothetical protein